MSSSTSSSDRVSPDLGAKPETREAKRGARLFLGTMALGLVLSAGIASVAPESAIHTPPEYGMAEAYEDHIEALCAAKSAPAMLILGDSRAVAGVAVKTLHQAGMDVEKLALGGAGIFAGWATLDRLLDCGVRPTTLVMAFGTVHILDDGAVMARTANYDIIKGPRASYVYDVASKWESSLARRVTYKAVSMLGTELTLLDLTLLRPALRAVLEQPPVAIRNQAENEAERVKFAQREGDRFYGEADGDSTLPGEAQYGSDHRIPPIVGNATKAIADLGKQYNFNVLFYVLPVNEAAWTQLPKPVFDTAQAFVAELPAIGITPLNDVWYLPNADFGDPSHVNARGREKVTADFIARLGHGL